MDGNLRDVLSAWKVHRKTRGTGVLDSKVVTVPKGACDNGQVFRIKPEPEEQHPKSHKVPYGESSVEQEDPLAEISDF